jgi:hypothetical protein
VGQARGPKNSDPLRQAILLAARPLEVGRIEVEALIEHRAGSLKEPGSSDPPSCVIMVSAYTIGKGGGC